MEIVFELMLPGDCEPFTGAEEIRCALVVGVEDLETDSEGVRLEGSFSRVEEG